MELIMTILYTIILVALAPVAIAVGLVSLTAVFFLLLLIFIVVKSE
jgi:hypothetical protein